MIKHSSRIAALIAGLWIASAHAANPAAFAYADRIPPSSIEAYAHPTGLIVTGRCNYKSTAFANARKAGAEVLRYLDAVERSDTRLCPLDEDFYMGSYSKVPLWGKDTDDKWRVLYNGHTMVDIRKNSEWSNWVVAYIEKLMRSNEVDGVFLDCIGGRLWDSKRYPVKWSQWPASERREWTEGAVDLVRRLDALRRQINPRFIIVNNNIWEGANEAERYVDGVVLEHPSSAPVPGTAHANYAARPFSDLGHRRVIVIVNSPEDAVQWAQLRGVTHVAAQRDYKIPPPPAVGFQKLTDRDQP